MSDIIGSDALEESFRLWDMFDPKCPKCGKVHKRKRIGNTSIYEVKGACKTDKGMFIPIENFKKGERRKDKEDD